MDKDNSCPLCKAFGPPTIHKVERVVEDQFGKKCTLWLNIEDAIKFDRIAKNSKNLPVKIER